MTATITISSTATLTGPVPGPGRAYVATTHGSRRPQPPLPSAHRAPAAAESKSPSMIHPCRACARPARLPRPHARTRTLATPPLTVAASPVASHSHAPATVADPAGGLARSRLAHLRLGQPPSSRCCSRLYLLYRQMRSAAAARSASIPARTVQDSPAAGCRAEPSHCSVLSGHGSWQLSLYAVAGCIV